jgi:DNA polymerase-4
VTDVCQGADAIELAKKIQKDLLERYNLPCSIGIAPNKFLAKTASDLKKPLGITVLRKREVPEKLWPLKIEDVVGIGKKTAPRLHDIGIHTIGDIANFKNIELLRKTVGLAMTEYLINRSNGIDNNPVEYENINDISSISNSHTFDFEQYDIKTVKNTLKVLTNSVSHRMENEDVSALTIGIQIKYNNFQLINRSKGLDKPISDNIEMYDIINELFDEYYDEVTPIRLVGVFATRLKKNDTIVKQYNLFDNLDEIEKENNVHELLNKINNSYGNNIINIGFKNKGVK